MTLCLQDDEMLEKFLAFAKPELSDELILFWIAIEKFKAVSGRLYFFLAR